MIKPGLTDEPKQSFSEPIIRRENEQRVTASVDEKIVAENMTVESCFQIGPTVAPCPETKKSPGYKANFAGTGVFAPFGARQYRYGGSCWIVNVLCNDRTESCR